MKIHSQSIQHVSSGLRKRIFELEKEIFLNIWFNTQPWTKEETAAREMGCGAQDATTDRPGVRQKATSDGSRRALAVLFPAQSLWLK